MRERELNLILKGGRGINFVILLWTVVMVFAEELIIEQRVFIFELNPALVMVLS